MREKGFTLIELMIVVAILGILAAIAIPNFVALQIRAKEGYTKTNMHTFQITAEDYGVRNDGWYADDAAQVAALLPTLGAGNLTNAFTRGNGANDAWEDRATLSANPAVFPGITSYADSIERSYNVKGQGKNGIMAIILTSGQ